MRHKIHRAPMAVASALLLGVFATSCSTEDPTDSTSGTDESSETSESPEAEESPEGEQEWFDQELYDTQFEQRSATFEGDPETPYLQYIDGEMTDTADYKVNGAQKACFANASISNPWRQTGWITMNQQLKDLKDKGVI